MLGVSPTLIRALRSHGDDPVAEHDRASIRILASTGEIALPLWWIGQAALWVVLVTALASAADYFRRFNLFPRNDVVARDDRVA